MNGHTIILQGQSRRDQAKRIIDSVPAGFVVNVKAPTRSSDQNAKLWAMLSDISRAKPQGRELPPEIWKSLFMAQCGFKPRFEPSLDGQGVVPVGYKSSRLSKAEFSELIESIAAFGAEHGVSFGDEGSLAA